MCIFRRIQAKEARSRIGGKCAANVDVKLINDDGIDRVCNRPLLCVQFSFFCALWLYLVACFWFGSFFYYHHYYCCYYYSHRHSNWLHSTYTHTHMPTNQWKTKPKAKQEEMESTAQNAACDRNEEVNCKNIRCKLLSWPEFRSSYFVCFFLSSFCTSLLNFFSWARWAACAGAFVHIYAHPYHAVRSGWWLIFAFLIIRRNF